MAAIVAAVLAVNLAVGYLGWSKWHDAPRHLVLTSFTTMVLLGVVATARHPTSRVTWMTTAVNGCGMLLFFAAAFGREVARRIGVLSSPFAEPLFFSLMMLLTIMLIVCIVVRRSWVKSDRGSPRFVRYYLISAGCFGSSSPPSCCLAS